MRVSVHGSFEAPNGVAFTNIDAAKLEPFAAGQGGRYRVNWGDRPFAHTPPGIEGNEWVSVAVWCSI